MPAYRQGAFALIICLFLLGGCASAPDTPENSAVQPQDNKQPQNNEPALAEELAKGKDVIVQTSQGAVSVSPVVVAVGDTRESGNTGDEVYYNDPWEGFNRAMFSFNNVSYQYVLLPLADGYHYVVPGVVRDKIGNAFDNLREPLNLVNNTFAGEFSEAGANLGRFLINSTVGLLGLFDPASDWFDIKPQKQTIANTLQRYDIGSGPYLVIPILGPSDPRGALSTLTEGFVHPVNYIAEPPESYQLRIFEGFDDFSNQSDTYRKLYEQAEDPYIYFRNQYIQGQRRDELFELSEREQQDNQ
ncbi:VacJ family lipoprotein [Alteromonas sp. NFXS44]|uniref:MlaA family lipoprotein n=1 Tax=Alteromonas sp. NFXS44 TaxID=2818435 RepID=UPI0032DF3840